MRDGWVETKLGLVSEFIMGQAPLGERCNKEGIGTPFVKAGEFEENRPKIVEWTTDPLKIAKSSDVLVCVVGATAGKINLGADCAIGRSVAAIRPGEKLHQLYLYYLLSLELSNLRSGSRGSAQGVITKDDLHRIVIALPPILEQERIVDLISSVDSYIEALQQQLETAKRSRNAVLHELLTAGGNDWVETTLDRVTECSWGNTETTKSKYVESGFLAYSASGADGFLDWFEHDRTAVVLSAIGAQCGKTWFAEGKWTSIKNTIWLKSDNSNLLDKYLFYLSNTDQFWQIRGQAQPFISLGDVKKTKVLLPPLREQERIVEVISEMDAFIESIQETSIEARNLRSGLLSDLLGGEHEIPASYDKVMGAA
jgi:type I restriction enzyme, S subunit